MQEVGNDCLLPHLDSLLNGIVKLLNVPHVKVQEGALSALAGIALIAGQEFIKYYDVFLPGVKNILFSCNGDTQRKHIVGILNTACFLRFRHTSSCITLAFLL